MAFKSVTGLLGEVKDATNVDFIFIAALINNHSTVESKIINLHNHKGTFSGALQFAKFFYLFSN